MSTFSNKVSRILCAAIHYDDGQKYVHQPKNITTGYVVAGRRHCNCILTNSLIGRRPPDVEGFVTTDNLFLDRKQACALAIGALQVKPQDVSGKLYSEDLW